jgi:hypothetical protein
MIYFVTARDIGRVKIGYSSDPASRFSKLQSDSPVRLALERICEGDEAYEKAVHATFAEHRCAGEWFTLCSDIEAHMADLPMPQAVQAKSLSIAQMIVYATGCAPSYAQQMLSPKYPHRVTIPVAISVYRMFGECIGPIVDAADHEIDTLEKFCGRFEKKALAA